MSPSRQLVLAAFLAAAPVPCQESLELGKLWTFDAPPLDHLERSHGFRPTQEWLDALRLATLRFDDGSSASFVSRYGLVMTNHHCVRDRIAALADGHDLLRDGFVARSHADERRLDGLSVRQLVSIRDVTAQATHGIEPGATDAATTQRRKENHRAALDAARREHPELDHEVVELFQGARVHVYGYRVFDDVRLVCAPHMQIANFGGDVDNFTYPRHSLDFAFCRVWAGDAPADTSRHHLRWCTSGVRQGELVFVAGNPSTTRRLATGAQHAWYRDAFHPIVNELVDHRLALRREFLADHPELERVLMPEILRLENSQKALAGYLRGLLDPARVAQKSNADAMFRARIHRDPVLQKRFGEAWDRLAEAAAARTALEPKLRFHTHGGHPVLILAMMSLRARDATEAPEARQKMRERALRFARKLEHIDELTRLDFVDHLERAGRWLGGDDPYYAGMLAGRTPAEVADALEKSRLHDPAFVARLLDETVEIDDATLAADPALRLARVFVPLMQQSRAANEELEAIESAYGALLGQALFAAYGTSIGPDATGTPRFSDGVVDSYPCNGSRAPYRTTFFGLFARHAEFDGAPPFDLPQVWLDRRARLDLARPIALVSSNDIASGNSGSPLVNIGLEVVGLVFDGNIETLPNRYLYRCDVPRAVSVHADGILEALEKVYDATHLADELLGRSR